MHKNNANFLEELNRATTLENPLEDTHSERIKHLNNKPSHTAIKHYQFSLPNDQQWLSSRLISMLDTGRVGPGFKSQPQHCQVTVLGKLFTPIVPLFTKQKW